MSKNNTNTDTKKRAPKFDTMGLLHLFVVASIVSSTYMVVTGTVSIIPKIMVFPQALYASLVLSSKFTKK